MNRRDRIRRLGEIQKVMDSLRQPEATPDFAGSILDRVQQQREFTTPETRRWVPRWRMAAILMAGTAALGVGLTWRYAPETVAIAHKPTPVSSVLCFNCQAVEQVQTLVTTIDRAAEARPADVILALAVPTPGVEDDSPYAGCAAPLPCHDHVCTAADRDAAFSAALDVKSAPVLAALEAEALPESFKLPEPSTLVFAGFETSPRPSFASERRNPAAGVMLASFGGGASAGPRPLAENLAPMLWGRPSRSSGGGGLSGLGAGLPK